MEDDDATTNGEQEARVDFHDRDGGGSSADVVGEESIYTMSP